MGQIFHPSANTLARVSIFGGLMVLAGLLGAWDTFLRSPYVTGAGVPVEQMVPFSHKHHVQQLGIDCRYCHTSVEEGPFAGIPPTKTCMNCHSQIWKDAPMLEPVRESFRTGVPLKWVRVHDSPDFVYFDHSVHVNKGIGCVSCHGQVDDMPLVWREHAMHMTWCLDCHRHPENHVRPREHVFDMAWQPGEDHPALASQLIKDYDIVPQTSCSVCHR